MKPTKWFLGLLLATAFIGCNQFTEKNKLLETDSSNTTSYRTNDTIPAFRKSINPKSAASFSEPVADELNKWEFAVNIYETKETFKYLIKMRYKELNVSENLSIPNFGVIPKIILKKGTAEHSCIIGFTDRKGAFKEYKMVTIKNDQLKLIVLKSYFVGVYQTKMK